MFIALNNTNEVNDFGDVRAVNGEHNLYCFKPKFMKQISKLICEEISVCGVAFGT